MTISSLFRAMGGSRRALPRSADRPVSRTQAPVPRHPAMSGLDVSPVHGRHCICERCAPDRLEQLRLAS